MTLSPGKLWGLRRMADANGRFKMTAVDQRPPIKGPIAKHLGVDEAPWEEVARFKSMLIETLQAESSAMLLDPHYAIPHGLDRFSPTKGLIVTLEDSLFQETPGGRLSSEIDDWSVEKIKRMGGDAVKVLAWYRPDADAAVNQHQQDFTKAIGAACAKYATPFLFELLVYPLASDGTTTGNYEELPTKRAEDILKSVEAFAPADFGIDVFKLESPIAAGAVPGVGAEGWEAAQETFNEMGRLAGRPWVMLSAGASKPAFRNILAHAYKAGASGYLAGRAIWADAFAHYPDWAAIRAGLEADSTAYMQDINALTDAEATPFSASFTPADASFRHGYPGFA